jgi:hypothetical protein
VFVWNDRTGKRAIARLTGVGGEVTEIECPLYVGFLYQTVVEQVFTWSYMPVPKKPQEGTDETINIKPNLYAPGALDLETGLLSWFNVDRSLCLTWGESHDRRHGLWRSVGKFIYCNGKKLQTSTYPTHAIAADEHIQGVGYNENERQLYIVCKPTGNNIDLPIYKVGADRDKCLGLKLYEDTFTHVDTTHGWLPTNCYDTIHVINSQLLFNGSGNKFVFTTCIKYTDIVGEWLYSMVEYTLDENLPTGYSFEVFKPTGTEYSPGCPAPDELTKAYIAADYKGDQLVTLICEKDIKTDQYGRVYSSDGGLPVGIWVWGQALNYNDYFVIDLREDFFMWESWNYTGTVGQYFLNCYYPPVYGGLKTWLVYSTPEVIP